jgi:hypothetical protein
MEDSKIQKLRQDIKFTIWDLEENKIKWLKNNSDYQKIEYVYENKDKGVQIDFLLGYKDETWQVWAGKLGSVNYDVDSYRSLNTQNFADAILKSLDIIVKLIQTVLDNPDDWEQYYINI